MVTQMARSPLGTQIPAYSHVSGDLRLSRDARISASLDPNSISPLLLLRLLRRESNSL